MKEKSWETLAEEVGKSGLTCLICCQGFEATKADSINDNDFESDTDWKLDTMFRMLDENLNYGKWEETEEEMNDPRPMHHSTMMDIRCTIAEKVAYAWVDAEQNVNDIESAQALADKLAAEVDYNKYVPIMN